MDLDVKLTIRHIWDEDLDVYLVSPNGRRVELFTDVGGMGEDFVDTILDDDASQPITGGYPPFTGRYRPEGNLNSLSGLNMKGTWTLEVTDDAVWISGTLEAWSLMIEGDTTAPSRPDHPCPADGTFCVPVDTMLSWGTPPFRFLGGTGNGGLNPFSLVELQTNPVEEWLIGPGSFNCCLDVAPDCTLYGASSSLRIIDRCDGHETNPQPIHSTTDSYILVDGIAFHPNGTLYMVTDNVLYTVNRTTGFATTITGIDGPSVWGIDFAPDGTLYGAYNKLVTIDPVSGHTQVVGDLIDPSGLRITVTDIDLAPDGSLYGVYYSPGMLYKIDPATAQVTPIGTYGSSVWGVASETSDCTDQAKTTRMSTTMTAHSLLYANADIQLASSEAVPPTEQDLSTAYQEEQDRRAKIEHLLTPLGQRAPVMQYQEVQHSGTDHTFGLLSTQVDSFSTQAGADSGTYDVYLDTVNPPKRRIYQDIHECWCEPGVLSSNTRYYWQVVARTASGETPGPVWSFNTATCALLFEDNFPTSSIDSSKWTYRYGSPTVDTDATSEPSTPNSLHLESHDEVQSRTLNLSGVCCAVLTYQWQRSGTESGDDLYVDFWDGQTWQALATHLAEEGEAGSFTKVRMGLPVEALHSAFRLRFKADCDSSWDEWFIDDIRLWGCQCTENFESGGLSYLPWTTCSGNSPWTVVKDQDKLANHSARAGTIGANQTSCLEITMDCQSGAITFDRKVSSEQGWDKLTFYINEIQSGQWSGSLNWANVSFSVPDGRNTFRWVYSKDGSGSYDSDTAWIDNVTFPTAMSVCCPCSQ